MSFNLEDDDYASEDDEEYVPGAGGDDEDDDLDEEDEDIEDEEVSEQEKVQKKETKPAAQQEEKHNDKERIDQLWAEFCADTDSPTTSTAKSAPAPANPVPVTNGGPEEKVAKQVVDDLFGEEDRTPPVQEQPAEQVPEEVNEKKGPAKRPAGLAGALGGLKKKKMSVLDKSDHDWNQYKQEKGISEELQTHNKGKDGYLGRMEFLTRADHLQFEKEKEARKTARKN